MDTLQYRIENQVGTITLNIPDKLNALRTEMKLELTELLRGVRLDQSVRALVITGAGRAFCAGGDVSAMGDRLKHNDGRDRMRLGCDWIRELVPLEKPVIAAVNGPASGVGLSIALACDFILCSEKASFCSSFVTIGLVPDMACLWNLPKRVGVGKAKDITYTGRTVRAQEALEIGLADRLVPHAALMDTARSMAESLAAGPTYTIGLTKSLIDRAYDSCFQSYMELEINQQAAAFHTQDHVLAVKAFLAKEEKTFIGM